MLQKKYTPLPGDYDIAEMLAEFQLNHAKKKQILVFGQNIVSKRRFRT